VVPTTNDARVDGHPAVAPDHGQVSPAQGNGSGRAKSTVSARTRARVERQTAVVHDASTSAVMRRWLAVQAAEAERLSIRDDLARAGLL
jgi:hypothetical protein